MYFLSLLGGPRPPEEDGPAHEVYLRGGAAAQGRKVRLGANFAHILRAIICMRGRGVGRHGGGSAALSQEGGGGQLLTRQGGIEGGTWTKYFSNLRKQQKNEFCR